MATAATKATQTQVFHVASRSRAGVKHVVHEGNGQLTCDCLAWLHYGLCTHVVAAQSYLDMLRGIEATAPVLTAKGHAYLRRWRAEQARLAEAEAATASAKRGASAQAAPGAEGGNGHRDADARDTAILRRSQAPFSLLK